MRFCTNCGEQVPDNARFCTNCGEKLAEPENVFEPKATLVPEPEPVREKMEYSPEKPAEKPAPRKKGGKKGLVIGGIALAVVIVALILVLVLGGGSADPAMVGRYIAQSGEASGMSVDVGGDWIELKKNGKADICLMGDEYSGKWESEDNRLVLTQAGDEFIGSLDGDRLSVDYDGLVYTYTRDGASQPAWPEEPTEPGAPIPEPDSPYAWWDGEWYGWWIVKDGSGSYESWEDNYWDAYAVIDDYGDGNGWLTLWDVDYSYDSPMAEISLSFAAGAGSRGTATAEGGYFMDADVFSGSFVADPDGENFGIEDMLFIEYRYEDPNNSEDFLDACIFLRPWGRDWEDVRGTGGDDWPYDDMMPMYYNEWYMPLIERGYAMPNSRQDGMDILSGAANVGSGDVLAGEQWKNGLIEVVGAEHFVDSEGDDAIRVYYDYTNTSDVNQSASDIVYLTVTQDEYDINCTYAAWDNTVAEEGNQYLAVRPGVSIRCVAEYSLKLSGGPICFEFYDYENDEGFTVEFEPKVLPGRPPEKEKEYISNPTWLEGVNSEGPVGDFYVYMDYVEIVESYEFTEAIRINFNFTNNSTYAVSFMGALNYIAFQDGVELASAWTGESDDRAYEEVQPGQSIQVSLSYELSNEQSPVEIEFYDYWSGDRVGKVYELSWGG